MRGVDVALRWLNENRWARALFIAESDQAADLARGALRSAHWECFVATADKQFPRNEFDRVFIPSSIENERVLDLLLSVHEEARFRDDGGLDFY